jgi:hypothetical protein
LADLVATAPPRAGIPFKQNGFTPSHAALTPLTRIPAMHLRLVALDGTADIPLSGVLTIIGRHRECDFRLNSSRISRRHCCLAIGENGLVVRDLGSTNGIRINGCSVGEGILRLGDVLTISHLRYLLGPCLPGQAPPLPHHETNSGNDSHQAGTREHGTPSH